MTPRPGSRSAPPTQVLKVGALARRAGLTVRTLHHYEEVGLLPPAGRTEAGHRFYGRAEVARLHQITALKQMGLSLEEIREALDGEGGTLEEVLEVQIQRLRERIQAEERLCRELESLRARLASGDADVALDELADSVGRAVRLERYYTSEQLRGLARRAEVMGRERMAEAQDAWSDLLAAFGEAMTRGKPVDHPEVAALARRSRELVASFTGGDPGIRAALEDMYRHEDPEQLMRHRGVTLAPGVWRYMQAALEALASID